MPNYRTFKCLSVWAIILFSSKYVQFIYVFRCTPAIQKYKKELKEGVYENSPEIEKRRLVMSQMIIIQSSKKLSEDIEKDRTYIDPTQRPPHSF